MKTLSTFEDGRTLFVGTRFRCQKDGTVYQIESMGEVHRPKFFADFAEAFVVCPNCHETTVVVIDLPDPNARETETWAAKGLY